MKKFFIVIIILFFTTVGAFAEIIPTHSYSINKYGIGTLNVVDSFSVYERPDECSRVLKTVNYERIKNSAIMEDTSGMENTLIAYVPTKNVALVTVETNNEDGWFEIYYDQKNGLTGWVYLNEIRNFRTWRETLYYWGKMNGIYLFRDYGEDYKRLYSQDNEESQVVDSFVREKYINFSVIRGNWMLASVFDVEKKNKIGWMKWRREDGTLLVFPRFYKI